MKSILQTVLLPAGRCATAVSAVAWAFCAVSSVAAAPPPPPEPAEQKPLVKQKNDDDLSRKLLRKAQSGGDEDVMDQIMRLMGEAATNMDVKLDPGPATQQLQKDILAKLDEAIKDAASRRRPAGRPDSKPHQDKRRRGGERDRQRSKPSDDVAQKAGESGDEQGERQGLTAKPVELPDGELVDVRRAWGHLPMREREEIIQGVGEEFLEKYREWVERYYKALQESTSEPK